MASSQSTRLDDYQPYQPAGAPVATQTEPKAPQLYALANLDNNEIAPIASAASMVAKPISIESKDAPQTVDPLTAFHLEVLKTIEEVLHCVSENKVKSKESKEKPVPAQNNDSCYALYNSQNTPEQKQNSSTLTATQMLAESKTTQPLLSEKFKQFIIDAIEKLLMDETRTRYKSGIVESCKKDSYSNVMILLPYVQSKLWECILLQSDTLTVFQNATLTNHQNVVCLQWLFLQNWQQSSHSDLALFFMKFLTIPSNTLENIQLFWFCLPIEIRQKVLFTDVGTHSVLTFAYNLAPKNLTVVKMFLQEFGHFEAAAVWTARNLANLIHEKNEKAAEIVQAVIDMLKEIYGNNFSVFIEHVLLATLYREVTKEGEPVNPKRIFEILFEAASKSDSTYYFEITKILLNAIPDAKLRDRILNNIFMGEREFIVAIIKSKCGISEQKATPEKTNPGSAFFGLGKPGAPLDAKQQVLKEVQLEAAQLNSNGAFTASSGGETRSKGAKPKRAPYFNPRASC